MNSFLDKYEKLQEDIQRGNRELQEWMRSELDKGNTPHPGMYPGASALGRKAIELDEFTAVPRKRLIELAMLYREAAYEGDTFDCLSADCECDYSRALCRARKLDEELGR